MSYIKKTPPPGFIISATLIALLLGSAKLYMRDRPEDEQDEKAMQDDSQEKVKGEQKQEAFNDDRQVKNRQQGLTQKNEQDHELDDLEQDRSKNEGNHARRGNGHFHHSNHSEVELDNKPSHHSAPEQENNRNRSQKEKLRGTFKGIGAQIAFLDEQGKNSSTNTQKTPVIIVKALPDSPALNAGLEPGDQILEVDGVETSKLKSIEEVIKLILGPEGTTIELLIKKNDQDLHQTLSIIRGVIKLEHLKGKLLAPDKILLLSLKSVYPYTAEDLDRELSKYQGKFKGIALDLRDFRGGRVDIIKKIIRLFARNDDEIWRTAPFNQDGKIDADKEQIFFAKSDGKWGAFPLLILMGPHTGGSFFPATLKSLKDVTLAGMRPKTGTEAWTIKDMEGKYKARIFNYSRRSYEDDRVRPDTIIEEHKLESDEELIKYIKFHFTQITL